MILDNLKMLEGIFNCFHFLHRRMLPRLLQFLHYIRSIIHRQAQISFYLCDICGMYFEAIFSFYVLLYHFVGHSLFGLVVFCSFSNIIKWNFSLTLAKLNFYVDMSVWLFVGKQYYRLDVWRKLLLILNSKTVAFCEKVHTPLRVIAFTPHSLFFKQHIFHFFTCFLIQ